MALMLCSAGLLPAEQIGQAVHVDDRGALVYEKDEYGNRLPDFSSAGYGGGGVALPVVSARVRVAPVAGDNTALIQAAIDHVASLPLNESGIRGAVLLEAGRYEISGQLRIEQSGVVLRGGGAGEDGTILAAVGTDRRTLIVVEGSGEYRVLGAPVAVADEYVPVGAMSLRVKDASGFEAGSNILIERPSPDSWLEEIGMHIAPARTHYRWREGRVDLTWERRVVSVEGNILNLDAPIVTALEQRHGGGTVRLVEWPGRISQAGIENLRLVSEYDTDYPMDEDHAWMGIQMDRIENAWVASVTGVHFVSSLVDLGPGARAVTVQDCVSLHPVSEMGGYRRHTFHTRGQQTLFLRCRAEQGRHDFTVGYFAGGPNVFLECDAIETSGMSGSIGNWASGALFDNVNIDGGQLALDNLEVRYGGVGWAAANSVLWQCHASQVICRSPPGALNWAIGVWGEFYGEGRWQKANENFSPESLYRVQLEERMGSDALVALEVRKVSWKDHDVPLFEGHVSGAESVVEDKAGEGSQGMRLFNGWLVDESGLITGGTSPVSWWRGNLMPSRTAEHQPHLTRFLPGRIEGGATDDLDQIADGMLEQNQAVIRHHWGLWYDRRREDHQMIRRASGDVWPPFYEMPWARSGKGTAWDGLSKFDLERFNPWYFQRLREFADIAQKKGRVLINEMYFQHNILEAGAHWAEFPWRPVNAIQETGFPEPPEYVGGKRVFMADAFYDVDHPVRRELHRKYIRQCLTNLAGEANVIHTVSEEYTGPLHFVQFWLDVIAEWIEETGNDPLIAISATKDVQDAVLEDPEYTDLIDVIEFKYWWQGEKGLFAPEGGQSMAPRQNQREWSGGRPTAATIAGMISEYRQRFPDKAILTGDLSGANGWAVVAAGGSIPNLPKDTDAALLRALPGMKPMEMPGTTEGCWILEEPGQGFLIYALAGAEVKLDLRGHEGAFRLRRIEPSTGRMLPESQALDGGQVVEIDVSAGEAEIFWIRR